MLRLLTEMEARELDDVLDECAEFAEFNDASYNFIDRITRAREIIRYAKRKNVEDVVK